MPISFSCECGKLLRAKDELAGKKTKCPQCGAIVAIPPGEPPPVAEDDVAAYLLGPAEKAPAVDADPGYALEPNREPESAFSPAPRRRESPAQRPAARPEPRSETPSASILEYAYLLLFFALIPLAFSLLGKEAETIEQRLEATMEQATPEQARHLQDLLNKPGGLTKEELLAGLPDNKLAGAHLPQTTVVHWVYGAVATVGFLLLILLMFSVERSNPLHLLGIGLFTGTIGIVFLLVVQFCSQVRFSHIRGRGWFVIIMLILAFIGWSYSSALDPDSNFFLSAVGFTFGVGLCEEATKAIPLLFYFRRDATMGWRGACLWGLASGIGFGVSEGIMYSVQSYNGISGAGVYVVRFVSCVALHAMWAGTVGISIARTLDSYEAADDWMGFSLYLLRVLAVPMTLHGFYDTLLKKDMNAWALVIAVASFGWFAIQIERARGAFPEAGLGRQRRRFA